MDTGRACPTSARWEPTLGAHVVPGGVRFRVWAPDTKQVVVALASPGEPVRYEALDPDGNGFHTAVITHAAAGACYRYRLDGGPPLPDPASRFQPTGVHGPSAVIDWRGFPWTDESWSGLPLERTVLYELHVGTFTPEGTFAAATARLRDLKDLGVTAVALMPVADFAGRWNWGYDGVALFAPARCYGHPDDLRRFVDSAHRIGLAVHLDVVYNHLGPDGAYQTAFSPCYRSAVHATPWGDAINFDGPGSPAVRDWVVENALHWIHEYHMDGLRLDATHAMADSSPRHVLAVLTEAVRHTLAGTGRRAIVVAEDHDNRACLLKPEYRGGLGVDAVWSDDFHNSVRRLLTGNGSGSFSDFDGTAAEIAQTARRGWLYCGQHAPSLGRPRGSVPDGLSPSRFVFSLQHHDHVGNRPSGARLHHEIAPAAWRAASVLLLVLPETPLLFMGQEWAASSPFYFFADHRNAVGRRISRFPVPDPQSEEAFLASRLDWNEAVREPHASVRRLYTDLLALRQREPTIGGVTHRRLGVASVGTSSLVVRRRGIGGPDWLVVICLAGSGTVRVSEQSLLSRPGTEPWTPVLTTEDAPYAPDPQPVTIEPEGVGVSFSRPGAVILRGNRSHE